MARLILIDDDPMFANIIKQHLLLDGHDVVHNVGAFGALTAVRQGAYDAILVDVHMPGIEGPKLVECFRERGVGNARIILMSSIEDRELKRLATQVGAHGYFCKTSGLAELTRVLGRVLDRPQSVRARERGPARRSGRPGSLVDRAERAASRERRTR